MVKTKTSARNMEVQIMAFTTYCGKDQVGLNPDEIRKQLQEATNNPNFLVEHGEIRINDELASFAQPLKEGDEVSFRKPGE